MRSFVIAALLLGSASASYSPLIGGGGRRLEDSQSQRALQAEVPGTINSCEDDYTCWGHFQLGPADSFAPGECVEGVCTGSQMCFDPKCNGFDRTCAYGDCRCDCVNQEDVIGSDNEGPGAFIPAAQVDLTVEYPSLFLCQCAECPATAFGCPPIVEGDPHIRSWAGEWFDYMGQCDLKLVKASHESQDIDIDIRTTIRYDYSFVEAAALKIGNDILEVAGFGDYALNGVDGALGPNGHSVPTLGGYPVYYRQANAKKHVFDVVLGDENNITISTYKDWVGVSIIDPKQVIFEKVTGLMGTEKGELFGPDGTDFSLDIEALGQSWQIQADEQSLFRSVRAPQAPAQCVLPDPSAPMVARRLGETIAKAAAEEACAGREGNTFKFCVHDVMVSGDVGVAAGAF